MSRPSNAIEPAVGFSCKRISFEVVVLPQPDSPIRPRVSPALTKKSTPSTARTHAGAPPKRRRTGKCLVRPRTSTTGEGIVQEPAARDVAVAVLELARLLAHAPGE